MTDKGPAPAGSGRPPRWPQALAIGYLVLALGATAWLIVRWQGRFP